MSHLAPKKNFFPGSSSEKSRMGRGKGVTKAGVLGLKVYPVACLVKEKNILRTNDRKFAQ